MDNDSFNFAYDGWVIMTVVECGDELVEECHQYEMLIVIFWFEVKQLHDYNVNAICHAGYFPDLHCLRRIVLIEFTKLDECQSDVVPYLRFH